MDLRYKKDVKLIVLVPILSWAFACSGDKVHKNIFDSESIKSNVKLQCFRIAIQNCLLKIIHILGLVNFGV